MDDLLSEKEQLEQMRAWWSEYGRYVIAGVVIAVGLLIGVNQYSGNKLESQLEASALYEQLAGHVSDGDVDAAAAVAAQLSADYSGTSYAAQSKLAMARLYMDANRDQDAADTLRDLLEMDGNAELGQIGRLRLARILIYQDKAREAIDLLEASESEAFRPLYDEALGDAYTLLGEIEAAGAAYRAALAEQGQGALIDRGFVQMKLNDLPNPATAMPAPAAEPPVPMPAEEAGPAAAPAETAETAETAEDAAEAGADPADTSAEPGAAE